MDINIIIEVCCINVAFYFDSLYTEDYLFLQKRKGVEKRRKGVKPQIYESRTLGVTPNFCLCAHTTGLYYSPGQGLVRAKPAWLKASKPPTRP